MHSIQRKVSVTSETLIFSHIKGSEFVYIHEKSTASAHRTSVMNIRRAVMRACQVCRIGVKNTFQQPAQCALGSKNTCTLEINFYTVLILVQLAVTY